MVESTLKPVKVAYNTVTSPVSSVFLYAIYLSDFSDKVKDFLRETEIISVFFLDTGGLKTLLFKIRRKPEKG
jgi:hypothetical protein